MTQGHLLACLGLVLICLLGWELSIKSDFVQSPARRPQAGPSSSPVAPVAGTEKSDSAADLTAAASVSLARPLFSRDRRPTEEPGRASQSAQVEDALPRLSGVIVGPHGHHAVFTDAAGKSHGKTEGDQIGRYVIRRIQPGIVVLLGPEGERVLYTSYARVPGSRAPGGNVPDAQPSGSRVSQ